MRPDSELIDTPFRELPATGSLIGAVIRNGAVMFPHSSDILRAGDRVIIFVESRRAVAGGAHVVRTGLGFTSTAH